MNLFLKSLRVPLKFLAPFLTCFCGFLLWHYSFGEKWEHASYDYLFRFGKHSATNKLVLILMDNEAHKHFEQVRGQWNRGIHADMLNKLADDHCPLVVLDVFFQEQREAATDQALALAMGRLDKLVLMANQKDVAHPEVESASAWLPFSLFVTAAKTNYGVPFMQPDNDLIVRRHWPFDEMPMYDNLAMAAARLSGCSLAQSPTNAWFRYYGQKGPWTALSYHLAANQATGYYSNKIVFIGNKPENSLPGEEDEFQTPYSRWTGEASGGIELNATAYLNLMNREWLERLDAWLELVVLLAAGSALGWIFSKLRPVRALGLAAALFLLITCLAASLSQFTHYWFPWLFVAGGQLPLALLISVVGSTLKREEALRQTRLQKPIVPESAPVRPALAAVLSPDLATPDAPDYTIFTPAFGHGAYGKVWVVKNAIGQWQALKAVYQEKFGQNTEPFEREFRGITRYKPISSEHPGLLCIDFVSTKKPQGYFYYVMELGDALEPGWEREPAKYRPRDLASARARAPQKRLPIPECVRIGIELCDALDFLHKKKLTHRDIKPQNIIFVRGRPKLADIGLVSEVHLPDDHSTYVGTPGYMPPVPEPPGSVQADIFGLGMVLYVISTGQETQAFPELSNSLVESGQADYLLLNPVILKACQIDRSMRYSSAAEMGAALREVQMRVEKTICESA